MTPPPPLTTAPPVVVWSVPRAYGGGGARLSTSTSTRSSSAAAVAVAVIDPEVPAFAEPTSPPPPGVTANAWSRTLHGLDRRIHAAWGAWAAAPSAPARRYAGGGLGDAGDLESSARSVAAGGVGGGSMRARRGAGPWHRRCWVAGASMLRALGGALWTWCGCGRVDGPAEEMMQEVARFLADENAAVYEPRGLRILLDAFEFISFVPTTPTPLSITPSPALPGSTPAALPSSGAP
ncbi:hypothetical protein HK405_001125, partial [Cladochytrium tenue]